jgi:hypothetical protein
MSKGGGQSMFIFFFPEKTFFQKRLAFNCAALNLPASLPGLLQLWRGCRIQNALSLLVKRIGRGSAN